MRYLTIAAMLLTASPALAARPATPSPQMPAGEFLARAEPLLKRSMATLAFSSEARSLAKALGTSAERNRAQVEADRLSGRSRATCLPPKGKAHIEANELLAFIRRMAPADRARSLEQAVGGYMASKYPCRV